jgi:alpha-tubulin suppressor-like RCC1 family protein
VSHSFKNVIFFLQLGTGFGMAVDMYAMANFPTTVESDEFMGRKVVKIAAGDDHSACVTSGGELFVWGMNVKLEPELISSLMDTKVRCFAKAEHLCCVRYTRVW